MITQLDGEGGIRITLPSSNTWNSFAPLLLPYARKTHGFDGFETDLLFLQVPLFPWPVLYPAMPVFHHTWLIHSASHSSWELLSGTCPCFCKMDSSLGGPLRMVSHFFLPPQISASSQIFPSLLMATPVPQARTPGFLSTPPSMHTSNSLLGHIEFAPQMLSNLSLPFQPSYHCFTSVPCQFCSDYGFPSRLSLFQYNLHTHCC